MNRQKGAFGICYWFYAFAAFLLAILGQTLLCGVLLGFVIVTEKNEWLNRQCIQAFFLALISQIISGVSGAITGALASISGVNVFSVVFSGLSAVISLIFGALSIVVLVFGIIAMVNTARGKDAGIPGLRQIAERAVGYFSQKQIPAQTGEGTQPPVQQ